MKNYKNYLIAILSTLLLISLSSQPSNGAPTKTYDAVKLAQYEMCLNANANFDIARMQAANGNGELNPRDYVGYCASLKP